MAPASLATIPASLWEALVHIKAHLLFEMAPEACLAWLNLLDLTLLCLVWHGLAWLCLAGLDPTRLAPRRDLSQPAPAESSLGLGPVRVAGRLRGEGQQGEFRV